MTIHLNTKARNELWWLIISVDYTYSRIAIAEHEFTGQTLTLWLEDKQDFKNTLDDCLQIHITAKQLAKFIKSEKFNSYKGSRMHPQKKYVYTTEIPISDPLHWYQHDASATEQRWAREALLKHLLTQLVENEIYDFDLDF